MNHKFKFKQRVAALCMAAMICCSLFPAGAFAEAPRADADGTLIMEQDKEAVTDDSHQTEASDPDPGEESTPKSSEAAATSQSADEDAPVESSTDYTFDGAVLYTDLPDTPTGSYMGSQGLPVATGETKIGISAWPNDQLEESTDSYLSADTLNSDDLTMMAPLLEGTDYYVDFDISTDRIYKATGDDNENSMDTLVIGENYWNEETLGKLTIRKTGNALTGKIETYDLIDPWMTGEADSDFSNEEKRYIENAEVGSGLLIVSKTVVPFNNDFPKDTELFRLMDTSPNRKS